MQNPPGGLKIFRDKGFNENQRPDILGIPFPKPHGDVRTQAMSDHHWTFNGLFF
jgi:hypothetical protein